MSGFNINTMGLIPYVADDRVERAISAVGPGTDHPIGFPWQLMYRMYWQTRFFKVGISNTPSINLASITSMSGGTLIGALSQAATLNLLMSLGGFGTSGYTKIKTTRRWRNRVKDGNTAKREDQFNLSIAKLPISPAADEPYISWGSENVNEGSICAAGPVHTFYKDNHLILIDFSSIFYYRYQYWPRVLILTPWGSSCTFYTDPMTKDVKLMIPGDFSLPTLGGVSFLGGLIPLYGISGISPLYFDGVIVNGGISFPNTGNTCCSQFYYDGLDQERAKIAQQNNCKFCEENANIKTSS